MSDLEYSGLETHAPLTQAQADSFLAKANFNVSFNTYDLNWMLKYNSKTPEEVGTDDKSKTPTAFHGTIAGIRVYDAMQSNGEDTIVGNGVHESFYDVRGQHPHLRSNGNNIDGYATRLTKDVATNFYIKFQPKDPDQPTEEERLWKYHVYFSRASINNILAKDGVVGIRFYSIDYPIEEKNYKTFMMVGVRKDAAGNLVDLQGDNEYVASDAPCPPKCPQTQKGLFSMKKGIDF